MKHSEKRGDIKVVMTNPLEIRPEYVNTINVHSNPFEFVIEFGYVDLPEVVANLEGKAKREVSAELRAKIVVSAAHMKGFYDAISHQYKNFEENVKKMMEK